MKIRILKIIGLILIIAAIIVLGLYIGNKDTRYWIDKNILKKTLNEEDLPTISIEEAENISIYAYSNYVVTYNKNILTIYNSKANKEKELNIQVKTPIFYSAGKYLLVADKEAQNLYLIYGDSLEWKKEVEGNISQITCNESGAVGVSVAGTTYKSVIIMYDIAGEEIFKTYLSTTTVTDLSISGNSKYLSFVEVNTSGTMIDAKVKTIDVDKAKNTPSDAIIYTYSADANELILKIKYNGDRLNSMTDQGIYLYEKGIITKIFEINDKVSFVDINLKNHVCNVQETVSTIFNTQYELQIISYDNGESINAYEIDSSVKKIYCKDGVVALNLGSEIRFINTKGWVIKTFHSDNNIKDIVIGDSVAGIIYKDRVEVLDW